MIDARQLEARNRLERAARQAHAMSQRGPIVSVADPRFVYVPGKKTDIRATFERARRGEFLNLPTLKAK